MGSASCLRPKLDHSAILLTRCNHRAAFENVVSIGLFDVDILAGLAGMNRGECMPVIGRPADNRIDGLILQRPTIVFDSFGFAARLLRHLFDARTEYIFV